MEGKRGKAGRSLIIQLRLYLHESSLFLGCKRIGYVTFSVGQEIGEKSRWDQIFHGEERVNSQKWKIFTYRLSY